MSAPGASKPQRRTATVLLLDTGNEWGGGTNSMIELLKRADRSRLRFVCCFYSDYRKGSGDSLTRTLERIGIASHVLPPLPQPHAAKLLKEALRLVFFWSRALRRRALWKVDRRWRIDVRARQIAALAREQGAELLYLNNQPSSNFEGYLAARLTGLPVVQHCRIDAELLPAEAAMVNRTAAAVICVSEGVLESMAEQGIRRELLCRVHNGIDLRDTTAIAAPGAGELFTIGTVGNLVPRKSVHHLLMAAARMKQLGESGFRVLIVGDGAERRRLETLAASSGLRDQVRFLGFVGEPLPLIAEMDVFAFCSRKEGFPRVLLEAMALGKPVIAADVIGPREAVEDGATGYLYRYGDIEKLASLLIALKRDPALRQRLGAAALERVQRLFSIESYVSGVCRVLERHSSAGSIPR
ncbi:MAG TPA: glycosyltransferase [Burkholderiales bacterium]